MKTGWSTEREWAGQDSNTSDEADTTTFDSIFSVNLYWLIDWLIDKDNWLLVKNKTHTHTQND